MYCGLIARSLLYLACMNRQVTGQFARRLNLVVGNDDIRGAVVQNTDDTAVVHGPSCQVAHALARSLAIEVAAFQCRQRHANLLHLADGRQPLDFIVDILGNVHRDVTTVALGPSVLPEVTGYLGNLVNFCFQGRTPF